MCCVVDTTICGAIALLYLLIYFLHQDALPLDSAKSGLIPSLKDTMHMKDALILLLKQEQFFLRQLVSLNQPRHVQRKAFMR
jgi:hypothetical protein